MNPSDPQSKRCYSADGVSPALRSQEAGGADSVKVLCIPENAINRPNGGTNGQMSCGPESPSPTLRASKDVPAVYVMADAQSNSMVSDELCGTVTAHASRGGVRS